MANESSLLPNPNNFNQKLVHPIKSIHIGTIPQKSTDRKNVSCFQNQKDKLMIFRKSRSQIE